jgi:hypothetical protein
MRMSSKANFLSSMLSNTHVVLPTQIPHRDQISAWGSNHRVRFFVPVSNMTRIDEFTDFVVSEM